ncbi:hypothetical protein [Cupriavidus sp. AU9028]|uniref:hypothetical protein n=1 Tax=Cupriavidus sp. AU9028 TaxID=2871157 RepID=UPI001C98172C|nr:hypothetical protein [Cupriavidus sp. AU9028]MBY4895585.1 hypothetical protein [Cupriavidus sp. AU9028]
MRRIIVLTFMLSVLVGGCAYNVSPDSYSVGAVGQVNRSIAGIIISARQVNIQGASGPGTAAGVIAGGAAGSAIGGGARANVIGAVGGALIGGLAAAAIEQGVTQQTGAEYVVQTENGNLMTVVQGASPPLTVGQRVLVLYGQQARLIADPRG